MFRLRSACSKATFSLIRISIPAEPHDVGTYVGRAAATWEVDTSRYDSHFATKAFRSAWLGSISRTYKLTCSVQSRK
ncbi:MAG TPA: hypothetical protein VKP30_26945, partial [Polyangiaceae bacterium]|nr:hypothetical protein [Polyangiaceae bacterium]